MPVSQSMIDGLTQMIADGVRQATIDGQTVTYNTTESLISARNRLILDKASEDAVVLGAAPGRIRRLFYAGRGY